jgi:hypothetical protein
MSHFQAKSGLTKRALDGWDSAAFSSIFHAQAESCSRSFFHARPPASNAGRWALVMKNTKKFMLNRRKLGTVLGIVLLTAVIIVSVLLNEAWLSSENIALHIVVDNRTNQQIGPFVISEHQEFAPVQMNQIAPFSKADVYYKRSVSWGENAIVMTDSNSQSYAVIPYFENDQKGRVDIRVECVASDGLSGKIRNLTSSYFSLEWNAWGKSVCE